MQDYNTTLLAEQELDVDQALVQHEKLVRWVARRQWTGGLPWADVLQAGRMGLWRALQHFDWERGTAFSSYAVPAITHSIWRAVILAERKPPEELTPHPPYEAPDLEDHLERVISYKLLHGLVAALPRRRWRTLIVTHYGLDG